MDTAQDLIQKPISILQSTTISDAIKKILEHNISRLIVKDSGKSVGIVTEKDIGFFLFNEKTTLGLDAIPLEKIMKPIEYVKGSESIKNCAKIMVDKKISSLAVGNENSLDGIFTKTDLADYFAKNYAGKNKVADFMTHEYITTHYSATLAKVIKKMLEYKVSRLITLNQENKPVGIISLRDFFRVSLDLGSDEDDVGAYAFADNIRKGFLSETGFGGTTLARDIMSKDLLSIKFDEDLATASKTIIENKVNGLFVYDDKDGLDGIISKTDITQALASLD
jgi:CBS domain-containing protein